MKTILKKAFLFALCASITGAVTMPYLLHESDIAASAAAYSYGDYEYEINDDDTLTITKYKGSDEDVLIPDEINGKKVSRIYLTTEGDEWQYWDTGAFQDNEALKSVVIPGSVKSIRLSAFSNCKSLKNVKFSEGLEIIDEYTFFGCSSLEAITIPDGVTEIGDYAFGRCNALTNIEIPDSVTNMGAEPFNETAWYDAKPDGSIYAGKVYYCYKGDMPSGTEIIIKNGTTGLAGSAFYRCTGMKSITIPDSVKCIGHSAFEQCTGLTEITIPESVTSIGSGAFYGCTGLERVNIPDKITNLPWGVFNGCTALEEIVIPENVTDIGGRVFSGCKALTKVIIPDSVKVIGKGAFDGCDNLTIYARKGSAAEKYAKENNIRFAVIPLMNNSTITTTAAVGEPIILSAKAIGGTAPYTYALMYKKSANTAWTKIGTKYGTKSTGSFTPSKAVRYDIMINVKDSTGKIKSKTFTVDVKSPLNNKTTINAETVKVGEKIVLKGAASGGTAGYKYAFYYKKSKNSDWLELIAPYTTKSIAFKPKNAINYDMKSVVKDADGRTTEKTFTVKVTK